jgi:ankyrin repeat protein
LHIAAASGNVPLVKVLAARGGNPNLLRKDGHTPFSVAVMAGDLEAVKELLQCGADIAMRYSPTEKIPDPVEPITLPRRDQSIMHIAVLGGSPDLVRYLYSKGAPLHLKNSANETPLQLADHQERYREAIERQGAEGDSEKLKSIVRRTTMTDAIKALVP